MTPMAYLYICDGDIDNPVLTHKKMDWPEKYPHWQEIPLVMAQPEQEPFGYFRYDMRLDAWVMNREGQRPGTPFYTKPPKRAWVGLTDEERFKLAVQTGAMTADWLPFMEAVEAKLKEKNFG